MIVAERFKPPLRVIPHPELLRLLSTLVTHLVQAGPSPISEIAERLRSAAWQIKRAQVQKAANDDAWDDEASDF